MPPTSFRHWKITFSVPLTSKPGRPIEERSRPGKQSDGHNLRKISASSRREDHRLWSAVQEELDWEVYRLYGLVEEDLNLCRPARAQAGRAGV